MGIACHPYVNQNKKNTASLSYEKWFHHLRDCYFELKKRSVTAPWFVEFTTDSSTESSVQMLSSQIHWFRWLLGHRHWHAPSHRARLCLDNSAALLNRAILPARGRSLSFHIHDTEKKIILQGKPEQQNSRSCRCECPAIIKLLRSADNGWYIAEHRSSHNHACL